MQSRLLAIRTILASEIVWLPTINRRISCCCLWLTSQSRGSSLGRGTLLEREHDSVVPPYRVLTSFPFILILGEFILFANIWSSVLPFDRYPSPHPLYPPHRTALYPPTLISNLRLHYQCRCRFLPLQHPNPRWSLASRPFCGSHPWRGAESMHYGGYAGE